MQKKFDHFLDIKLIVLLAKGDEGDDEGYLHFGLVEKLLFASGLSELVEDDGTGDGAEDEHVEEYIEDEHAIVPGILFDGWQLVVGIGVVGAQDVRDEYHSVWVKASLPRDL